VEEVEGRGGLNGLGPVRSGGIVVYKVLPASLV
jgi:hypothetical protein